MLDIICKILQDCMFQVVFTALKYGEKGGMCLTEVKHKCQRKCLKAFSDVVANYVKISLSPYYVNSKHCLQSGDVLWLKFLPFK